MSIWPVNYRGQRSPGQGPAPPPSAEKLPEQGVLKVFEPGRLCA